MFCYFAFSKHTMLSNIFGKKEDNSQNALFTDKVFLNNTAKMHACVKLANENETVLFIAWFSETALEYRNVFLQFGIDIARVIEVQHLHEKHLENRRPVFVEHYPLNENEIALTANWNLTGIPVFSAMDEPLFKHFGSDKMVPLIKLLGFKESEPIEHSYVTQSIIKGQQKIADRIETETPANSQKDWMEINLK